MTGVNPLPWMYGTIRVSKKTDRHGGYQNATITLKGQSNGYTHPLWNMKFDRYTNMGFCDNGLIVNDCDRMDKLVRRAPSMDIRSIENPSYFKRFLRMFSCFRKVETEWQTFSLDELLHNQSPLLASLRKNYQDAASNAKQISALIDNVEELIPGDN